MNAKVIIIREYYARNVENINSSAHLVAKLITQCFKFF